LVEYIEYYHYIYHRKVYVILRLELMRSDFVSQYFTIAIFNII